MDKLPNPSLFVPNKLIIRYSGPAKCKSWIGEPTSARTRVTPIAVIKYKIKNSVATQIDILAQKQNNRTNIKPITPPITAILYSMGSAFWYESKLPAGPTINDFKIITIYFFAIQIAITHNEI